MAEARQRDRQLQPQDAGGDLLDALARRLALFAHPGGPVVVVVGHGTVVVDGAGLPEVAATRAVVGLAGRRGADGVRPVG